MYWDGDPLERCHLFPKFILPCWKLSSIFPIVRQSRLNVSSLSKSLKKLGGENVMKSKEVCVEELILRDEVINTYVRSADGIPMC